MDATTADQPTRLQRLGQWLSDARDVKGLTLADVEDSTRIRRKFLTALESGDWGKLPSEVVGRGFLRNYAVFLGLSPEEALALLHGVELSSSQSPVPQGEESSEAPVETTGESEVGTPSSPSTARSSATRSAAKQEVAEYGLLEEPLFEPRRVPWLRIVGIVLVILILAAVGFASWAYWNNPHLLTYIGLLQPTNTPTPTMQPEPAVTRITATPTNSPTITPTTTGTATVRPTRTATTTPSATPTFRATPATGLELFLRTLDRCWIDVYADDEQAFEGLLERGEEAVFLADSEIRLTIGDAGSLEVVLNGQPLGTMGEKGEILWMTWVLDADQILQMSFTPTPFPDQTAVPTVSADTPVTSPTAES